MTKEKAIDILNMAFDDIFDGIASELSTRKVDLEQDIYLSSDIETIRSLCEELNVIDKALSNIDSYKDYVRTTIENKDNWYGRSLLFEVDQAFSWLPEKDEAK